jgi:predicted Fe-Mo cluster-binding NifX family protein
MNIAIAAEGCGLNSQVSAKFKTCKYLLIANLPSLAFKAVANKNDPFGENMARMIVECDCEAVITGELTPEAFNILADACVTRFVGHGHTANDALKLMEADILDLIRNVDGSYTCGGDHHIHTCDGHHHDDE